MRVAEFQQLITDTGLNHLATIYGPTFLVSFYFRTTFGLRVQCEAIRYSSPAEFSQVSPERAQYQIETLKSQLERAARTQQGVVCYPAPTRPATPKKAIITPVLSTINYPAH